MNDSDNIDEQRAGEGVQIDIDLIECNRKKSNRV